MDAKRGKREAVQLPKKHVKCGTKIETFPRNLAVIEVKQCRFNYFETLLCLPHMA